MDTLLGTIGGIEYYQFRIEEGDKLGANDMATLISAHITLKAYNSMIAKTMSEDQFITYVHDMTFVEPIVLEPETPDLQDLSEDEMNTLLGTIGAVEYYQDRIEQGDKLAASDMTTLISLHITVNAYKSLFEHENWSDELFMTWVREETGTKIDEPVVVRPDPVEDSKDLSDLTEEEIDALKISLNRFEDI